MCFQTLPKLKLSVNAGRFDRIMAMSLMCSFFAHPVHSVSKKFHIQTWIVNTDLSFSRFITATTFKKAHAKGTLNMPANAGQSTSLLTELRTNFAPLRTERFSKFAHSRHRYMSDGLLNFRSRHTLNYPDDSFILFIYYMRNWFIIRRSPRATARPEPSFTVGLCQPIRGGAYKQAIM